MRCHWPSFAPPVTEFIGLHIQAGQGLPVPTHAGLGIDLLRTSPRLPHITGSVGQVRTGADGWNDGFVDMEKNYEDWAADAGALHELAQQLLPQSPKVQVHLPGEVADRAVAAWQRDEDPGNLPQETAEQRSIRNDAGTLALIGQSIEETGIEDGDDVHFTLDAWILGVALEAADKAGRLEVFPQSD